MSWFFLFFIYWFFSDLINAGICLLDFVLANHLLSIVKCSFLVFNLIELFLFWIRIRCWNEQLFVVRRAFVNIDLRSYLDIILLQGARFYGLTSSWFDIHEDFACFRLLIVAYEYDTYDKFALITFFQTI